MADGKGAFQYVNRLRRPAPTFTQVRECVLFLGHMWRIFFRSLMTIVFRSGVALFTCPEILTFAMADARLHKTKLATTVNLPTCEDRD